MNPFDLKTTFNRVMEFNPFKPQTTDEIQKDSVTRRSKLNELKELLDIAERLSEDARYQKIRSLKLEQLNHNIELLKTIATVDANVSKIQSRIETLEEELDFTKYIRREIKRMENEPRVEE
jgi:hypothetical protein